MARLSAFGMLLWIVAGWGAVASAGAPQEAAKKAPGALPSDDPMQAAAREAQSGNLDAALGMIRKEAAKHPEWSPPRVILARILFASDRAPIGRRVLEQAAAESPDHPDVYLIFGALALAEGRLSDARLNFEKARALLDAAKKDDEPSRSDRREAVDGLARVDEAREDWASARRWLAMLLELEPKSAPARQRLGRALFRLGKNDEALAALEQAARDEPVAEPAPVAMALLYSQKGDAPKAEEWFERARKAEPDSARVERAWANWLVEQGRAFEARKAIERAAGLKPGDTDTERLHAVIDWHLGDPAGAQRILEPLHRRLPEDFAINNLLALCLADQADRQGHDRALQLAEANFRRSPRSHDAMGTLGWALYRAGRLDQAAQVLRQAVAGVRTTPDVAYYLACALADKGDKDDARKLLRTATGLSGAFAHRKDAQELLESLGRGR